MSIREALRDPVVKVFVALSLIPLTLAAVYALFMIAVNQRYRMLTGVLETWRAAQACQHAVEAYYAKAGHLPTSERDVDCHGGGSNVAPVKVAAGVITVTASGDLREALEGGDSGLNLRLTPSCAGACTGSAIVKWDCATGSTIARRYRPSICR